MHQNVNKKIETKYWGTERNAPVTLNMVVQFPVLFYKKYLKYVCRNGN